MKKSICLMLSVILAVSLLLVFSGCDFIKKRPDDTKEPAETLPSGLETSDTGEESGGEETGGKTGGETGGETGGGTTGG